MVKSAPPEQATDKVLARYGSEDEYYREFVKRLGDNELAIQQCDECGYLRWPPTRACPECWADKWHWQPVDGKGKIWSVAIYERSYGSHRKVPYNVALVKLDCGPTMLSTIVGTTEPQPDQRVKARFDGEGPGLARLVFEADGGTQ